MSRAKDFQRETAERIIEIFRGGQKRVLLSDEVGLGKTIMARTVVELAKTLPHIEDDGVYRVVYVCSNQNIIQQNTRNLGIPESDIMQLSDSRLSMQHLVLQERFIKQSDNDNEGLPCQLIPLTPATSFSMTSGAGSSEERALIYSVLIHLDYFKDHTTELSLLLKTRWMRKNNWDAKLEWTDWKGEKHGYLKRVNDCNIATDGKYIETLEQALNESKPFNDAKKEISDVIANNKTELESSTINKLRIAFSRISLEQLNPDLVIMDEFQRFSGLLNTKGDTEESMVAHTFFTNPHPYILLLSATPYKPFTTLEELNEDNCDEQYEDFLKLMRFLFKSEQENEYSFNVLWEDYSNKLSHISSDSFDALIISKNKAENKMCNVMCRTERFSEGLIKTTPLEGMRGTESDILSYCQLQKILQEAKKILSRKQKLDFNPCYNIPIEYVKSAPYLLSFMEKYQEGKTIEKAFDGKKLPIVANSQSQRLLLKGGAVYNYKPLKSCNGKFDALHNMLFKNHAEQLLWVPASHPYYKVPEDNVFYKNRDFSKVLVFSAWEMVPRMLAILLSYESERMNVSIAYKEDNITYVNSRKVGMNLIRKGEGENLLKLPSDYLASKYDYKDCFGDNINDIISNITDEIQHDIDELHLEELNITGAELLIDLINRLDGKDVELRGIPKRAAKTLAYMAVASPAVCLLRILRKAKLPENAPETYIDESVEDMVDDIIGMFNRRESSAAVKLTSPKGIYYYEQVLYYCAMGNLQSVLDEYCHMIDDSNDASSILKAMNNSFVPLSPYKINTTDSYCKDDSKRLSMRKNFAFDYAKITADKNLKHNGTLQQAFNSPFRPFVLATTSVGQEGLDFHWYARKIVHWNLPSNPVDMEQREGRINRFKCLAIRRNVAKFFGDNHTWKEMFDAADTEWRQNATTDYSEMVPFWCLPTEVIHEHDKELEHIERIVPLYPMSTDVIRYGHLINVLSLYRLTMGQPRQEELLQLLEGKVTDEQMKKLLFDLSPYSRNRKNINENTQL